MAGFVATNPGPLNSVGPVGDPGNGFFNYNYAGADFAPGNVTFTGVATAVNPSTYQSELRWRITNPAGSFVDGPQMSSVSTWTGPATIGPVSWSLSSMTGSSVGNWTFGAWESYDDSGIDATWTNMSFTITDAVTWNCTNYFDEPSFLGALASPYYVEDFSTYTYGNPLNGSQLTQAYGPVNGYSWTASAANGLWSNLSALSTNTAFDPLVCTMTGSPVTMVGGNFTATDINGNNIPGTTTITLANGATWSLVNQGAASFFGFQCSIPIASVSFNCATGGGINRWVQIDHFYIGVPEPASLLLLGLASLFIRRR
jgi:hypothetical protein